MNRIITIGREFGSGGRELGRRLAENLKIAYYDREIVEELAKRTELAESYITQIEEHSPLPLLPITTCRTFGVPSNQVLEERLSIYRQESEIIREIAEKSDCVIVGRCADYVLSDFHPFRLFAYADMKSKIMRCRKKGADTEEMTDREIRQKIASIDKKRARYYQFYTDNNWGDKANYDLCVNTGQSEIKKLADALAVFITSIK